MKREDFTHPARVPDFLSRLHDGDLTASERAHFESHRAHCGECRRAASEFEAALSLFRSTRTSPPAADLSSRILRRLQAATPRHSLFGVVHGINLKWAAGFAVALIAAVLGYSVIAQRESARRATAPTPIPVSLEGASREAGKSSPRDALGRPDTVVGGTGAAARKEAAARETPAPGRAPETLSASASPAESKRGPVSSRDASERAGEASDLVAPRAGRAETRALRSLERSGGEGATAPSVASAEPGAPARIVILALDGGGNAPSVVTADATELLAGLRGQRFELLVEAGGRVREAKPDGQRRRAARQRTADSFQASAPPSVWSLRFSPGDRPRRLLLRIE